ncbi:MAG: hypothetical protein RIR76_1772 [Verrucomicrobiota bacterium]
MVKDFAVIFAKRGGPFLSQTQQTFTGEEENTTAGKSNGVRTKIPGDLRHKAADFGNH